MPSHALRASSPSRMSPTTALRIRAHRERPRPGRARTTSTTPSTATTAAIAISGMDDCTGDGSASSTTTVRTACTTCPAERSHTTARTPRPTSCSSRPWRDGAMDVAENPAGQRDVEEQRLVVRAPPQRAAAGACRDHGPRSSNARHSTRWSAPRCRPPPPAPCRRPCERRRRTGRCRPARPGRRGSRPGPGGGPTPMRPGSSWRPACSGQDQQVGVVHGDRELSGALPPPDAGARRRRSRPRARPAARRRHPPTRRTTPPPGRPARRRVARGWAGRGPRPPAGRTPRPRPRPRPGRAGGRAPSRGAGGRRTRRPRGSPVDPPASARRDRRPTGSAARGTPAPAQTVTSPPSSSPVSMSSSAEAVMRLAPARSPGSQPGDVGLPRLDRDRGPVGGRAGEVGGGDLQQVGVPVVQDPVLRPGQQWREPAAHRPGAAAEVVDHPATGCRKASPRGGRRVRVHGPRRQRARAGQASRGLTRMPSAIIATLRPGHLR